VKERKASPQWWYSDDGLGPAAHYLASL